MGVVLKAEDVSIRYITGDFKDIGIKEYTVRKLTNNYNVKEFMAVDGVSFELNEGDMLGIVGSNGAGKSTLLKAIAGIMEPTHGKITANGEIAALLELGSGFDGDLTVKENAYLRGAMLGYTREFMDETYDRIIDFAELREFEDRPFKQLSSGMKSRLAFSIASLVDPDILILDEVLSVGDGAFQEKSAKKMREIISQGATTILVSHSLEQIRELCNKVLWLDHGKQIAFGDAEPICDKYEEFLHTGILPKKAGENLKDPCKISEQEERNNIISEKDLATYRESSLDFARTFAILMVILIHTVEAIYGTGEWVPQLEGASFVIYSVFKLFGRIGVPIFLMLTGYFLLGKDYSNTDHFRKFYRFRFFPMLISVECWILIYWVIQRMLFVNKLWFGNAESIKQLVKYLLIFDRNAWQISWYIPVLILVYLFIPFLAKGLHNLSKPYMIIPVIYFFLQEIAFWTINSFFAVFFPSSNIPFIQCFRNTIFRFRTDCYGIIGIYISFVILGIVLRQNALQRIKTKFLLLSGALLILLSVFWLKGFFIRDGIQYTIWYEWLPVDLLAIIVFELFRRSRMLKYRLKINEWISKHSLGYFFVHGIVLNVLAAYVPWRTGHLWVDTVIYVMSIFAVSTLIVWVVSKIPGLNRLLMRAG